MTRIYDDRGLRCCATGRRLRSSSAPSCWGMLEIVRGQTGMSDTTGYLFGVGFVGAAVYGGYRIFAEARDTIVRLETDDASGQSVVTLWRPWGLQRMTAPLDRADRMAHVHRA